jgi:hypothetical protein
MNAVTRLASSRLRGEGGGNMGGSLFLLWHKREIVCALAIPDFAVLHPGYICDAVRASQVPKIV